MKALLIVLPDEDAAPTALWMREASDGDIDPQIIGWPPDPEQIRAITT